MAKTTRVALAAALLALLGPVGLSAQNGALASEFPELAALFNSFAVTQAAVFDELVEIGGSGDAEEGLAELRETLMMRSGMTHAEMMQMGMHGGMDGMPMGPMGELETRALEDLRELLREDHSADDASQAFARADALPESAASVIQRGREFETQIAAIYADESVSDKYGAVNAAVDAYLADSGRSVPAQPKDPALMYAHPFASAFQVGYPQLSGLVWAAQWLQLASLEPLMLGGRGTAVSDGVGTTIERFNAKLDGMQGMSMLPSEIPMVPAISPLLFSRHEEAATIIDNLNLLETIVADLLAHPDVNDRSGSIEAVVAELTDHESNLVTRREYLLSALRGGIFNQGGPALGELARSERNRSRMEMEMGGHVSLPGMN